MLVGDRTGEQFRILRYQRFYTEAFTYVSVEHYLKCGFRCIYCITDSQGKTRPTIADPAEFQSAFAHDLAHFDTDNYMFCVSGATDPYNDLESEYGFTRHVVDVLTTQNRRFSITTKGPLVVRDIDLFLRMPSDRYKVLVTISASTTELARRMEPFAPPPEDRIAAVHQLQAAGVHTFVGVYPWIPEVTDTDRLLSLLPKGVTVCFQPLELGHNFDETLDNQRSRFSADRGFSKAWTQDEINRAYIHECNTVGRKYWKEFTMEWRHPITRASHSDNGGYLKKMRPGKFDPDQWVAENPVCEPGRN